VVVIAVVEGSTAEEETEAVDFVEAEEVVGVVDVEDLWTFESFGMSPFNCIISIAIEH